MLKLEPEDIAYAEDRIKKRSTVLVIGSFEVSYIKIYEIVHRSLTVFARKRELKISLTGAL